MTKHDLKELAAMGAELGAAKAEIQTLRTALLAIDQRNDNPARFDQEIDKIVRAALSQHAEPTDTYTAVDMATAAAQGFRDGQAAVEQAAVQDEREAVERFSPTTSVPHCGRASEVEAYMTEDDDGEYMTVAQHERIVAALTRPAQTEQQLAADLYEIGGKLLEIAHTKTKSVSTTLMAPRRDYTLKDARATALVMGERLVGMADRLGRAAPIAQTASQATTSDQYRAELYDEVWGRARSMGYVNVTDALIELERMKAAPQPEHSGLVEVLEKIKADTRRDDPLDHYDMVCRALASYRAALSAQGGEA